MFVKFFNANKTQTYTDTFKYIVTNNPNEQIEFKFMDHVNLLNRLNIVEELKTFINTNTTIAFNDNKIQISLNVTAVDSNFKNGNSVIIKGESIIW